MKKAPKAKPKKRLNKKLLAIVVGVAILISAQLFFNYYLWSRRGDASPTVIRSLVIQANDNLYRTAPVDAKTGDLYIPEAHLHIPAVSGQGVLHYMYEPSSQTAKNDEEIYLSGNGWNYGRAKLFEGSGHGDSLNEFFAQVPLFQACSRQFLVKFNKTNSSISTDYTKIQSLTLTDGRIAYLYSNVKCTQPDNNFIALYFTNIESY